MQEPTDGDLVTVFRTADTGLLTILKTVLESAEIPFIVQGGGALGMLPLGPLATGVSRNLLAASLLVPSSRASEAVELLRPLSPLTGEDEDSEDNET